ncbi:helix-turn-helix transcriptional regulator [Actinoplanes philippinensis]|uniref:helix-turn-helix transcriptional regulator n=1 Tax=Actinoplanes philippinensis TaxID=35752 RepID=UPI000B28803C|nr:hypothetical protein [Actinoplanes philippinensis]
MSISIRQDLGDAGLVGAHEIRELFGFISRQRVFQITSRPDFPRPVADLAQGKVWLASEVVAWQAHRRSGRGDPRP